MKQDKRETLNKLIAPRRGEVYGADKPEYWNKWFLGVLAVQSS